MSVDSRYRSFFELITKRDVQFEIQFLKARLPKKATRNNYQLTRKILNIRYKEGEHLQSKLQQVADLMCQHLLITRPIKVITMRNIDAGKFEIIDNLVCIYVNDDMIDQNFDQKVAILAHEMSHYYLMKQHGIVKPKTEENELLTEVNAVYVGFGFLLLRGYKENRQQEGNKIKTTKVGYVGWKIIYDAIIETAYVRRQKPQWIIKNIGFPYNLLAVFSLFNLYLQYRKLKRK